MGSSFANVTLKNHQMQFICVVTARYTLGFLMTKNPWLVFRLKHEISKQNFFEFLFMENMLIIQFHSMEKCLSYNFIYVKNAYFAIFIHILLLYEIV